MSLFSAKKSVTAIKVSSSSLNYSDLCRKWTAFVLPIYLLSSLVLTYRKLFAGDIVQLFDATVS